MTDLQKKEFELLCEFVRLCDELGLRYYLVCGSALGAVKYQGFIPWDDDVDVGMPREDYERFLKEAPTALTDGFFLQTYRTDAQYPNIYAKLRNSNTTFIERSVAHLSINHGIYIDVFPLDGYPRGKSAQKRLERKKLFYKLLLLSAVDGAFSFKVRVMWRTLRLFGVHKHTARIVSRYERLIAQYPIADSALWCNHGNWQGKLEYAPREQYGDGAWASFAGLRVRVPEQYDAYLTQKYGDWRADLPEDKKVGHHYYSVMDPDKPFTEYTEYR